MVALVVSLVITALGVGAVLSYGRRRTPDATLTWGEAMAASAFVFFLMFWVYGVVPHQWLAWADNELNWRSDAILVGPGGILERALPFTLTYQVVRDLIAVSIYGVALGGQIVLWSMWQNRGKTAPAELETSRYYGRPLVKKG